MIPLFNVEGNRLTSLKGEVSSFFEILPPDLEGLDVSSKERVFADLESDLINTEGVFKLYWLRGKIYLNSFSDLSLSHGDIQATEKPVETFLGQEKALLHFYENYLTCGN